MSSNEAVKEDLTLSGIEKMLEDEPETLEIPPAPKEGEEVKEEEPVEEEIKLELDDLDEDEKEPDEEAILNFPRRKEILKKYPTVFKDFPALETAYYKVGKINEIFPSLDDARQAQSKAAILDRFEQDIFTGNIKPLLQEVKAGNENSFNKIVDNLFQVVHEINPAAFANLQKDVVARLITGMYDEAKENDNETIRNAADIVKQLIFGSGKVETKKLATEEKPNPEKEKFENERRAFNQQRFESAAGEMGQKIQTILRATIEKNIDPQNSMSSYVKKNAVKDALDHLETMMRNDLAFRNIVTRCWDNIWKNNYSKESLDKLNTVYKSRASTLMPTAIKKARSEALKTTKDSPAPRENNKITSGRVAPVKSDGPEKKGRRMSTYEFLMKD